jgi:hypothetical protein
MGIFLGDKPVTVFFNGAAAGLPVQGVFLGGIQVFPTGAAATVPGTPTVSVASYDGANAETVIAGFGLNNGADVTSVRVVFSVAGELTPGTIEIVNINETYDFDARFAADYSGQTVQVFATNSVGEGEGNTPVAVTAD